VITFNGVEAARATRGSTRIDIVASAATQMRNA